MPIFGKFTSKKNPVRKPALQTKEETDELFLENRAIPLKLGEHEVVFENGIWSPDDDNTNTLHKTIQALKASQQELLEANNMLQLKNAILLNMLTQATADCHTRQKEIEKLQKTKTK
ncbi:uncharacterized protein Cby [Atheta coriaria]|uniref:uncharacterized protein Cby n=1 Tax=Dalotia coriaria TaxID=877792 RepID=UPI0031F43A8A